MISKLIRIFVVVALLIVRANGAAETNVLVIPDTDKRAGAMFFVDECLTRGITNSILIGDLQKWATNTIRVYQQRESGSTNRKRYDHVSATEIPDAVKSIQTRIPSCRGPKYSFDGFEKLVKTQSAALSITEEEASNRLRTLSPDSKPPRVGFYRSSEGDIQAVTIGWYFYSVIVGPSDFRYRADPWYKRNLADGIYLTYRYK